MRIRQRDPSQNWRSGLAALWAISLLACGGGDGTGSGGGPGNGSSPPPQTPTPAADLRITDAGLPMGSSTTVSVKPTGGTAAAAGARVQVPPEAFAADATLQLQPITNPVEEGLPALSLSSSEPVLKPVTVSLPVPAGEARPQDLLLATREADGSWLVLDAVTLDLVAGTVSATLPVRMATAQASTSRRALARIQATAARLNLRQVIAFHGSYLKPDSASVRTGATLRFVPYTVVTEWSSSFCPGDRSDDLAPVCRRIINEYPYTNAKTGYFRTWSVDGIPGGDASRIGTVSPDSLTGATYTAPAKKPDPDTVTVGFRSQSDTAADQRVDLSARVKIIDDVIQTYVGPIDFKGRIGEKTRWTGKGELTWTLDAGGHLEGDLGRYTASGTLDITYTAPDCEAVTAPVPITGALVVFDPTRSGDGDAFAHKHWFLLTPAAIVTRTARCGPGNLEQLVALSFSVFTACSSDPKLATAPRYEDIALLDKTGTWSCLTVSNDVSYRFQAR